MPCHEKQNPKQHHPTGGDDCVHPDMLGIGRSAGTASDELRQVVFHVVSQLALLPNPGITRMSLTVQPSPPRLNPHKLSCVLCI